MSQRITRRVAVALVLGTTGVKAAPPMPAELADLSAPMQASVQLPGTGVQMVETDTRVFYLGGNGRYVFTGPAWDLWHGAALTTVAQASALAERIDLTRITLDAAELGAFALGVAPDQQPGAGHGAANRDAWVFVDPRCSRCLALLTTLEQAGTPAQVVLLPIGGEKSLSAARRLHCAPSRAAAWSALIDQAADALPEPAADCDTQPLVRALITAQLLGVTQVPTLIASDGRLHQGVPDDAIAWLAGE